MRGAGVGGSVLNASVPPFFPAVDAADKVPKRKRGGRRRASDYSLEFTFNNTSGFPHVLSLLDTFSIEQRQAKRGCSCILGVAGTKNLPHDWPA